jgi:hemolysin type calcium-binding protein
LTRHPAGARLDADGQEDQISKRSFRCFTIDRPLLTLVTAAALMAFPATAGAVPLNVNSDLDFPADTPFNDGTCASIAPGGVCTLRAAVQEASGTAGDDTINLPGGFYDFDIAGTGDQTGSAGDLDLNGASAVTIVGAGASTTTISADGLDRVFDHPFGENGAVSISGVTITGGGMNQFGGAILDQSTGTLSLSGVAVVGNSGALGTIEFNLGTLTITNSTISGNTASSLIGIGGLNVNAPSTTSATLTNVTVSSNSGGNVGGVEAAGDATITLVNSTIVGNTSTGVPGGPGNLALSSVATEAKIRLKNTIVANGTGPTGKENCGKFGGAGMETFETQGHNLEAHGTAALNQCGLNGAVGDITSTNALLGPLASNGGQTQTHALLAGSPAIDAVLSGCPPPATDQRGVARPQGARCDIGGYEFVPPPAPRFCQGRQATIVGQASQGTVNGTSGRDVIVDLGGGTVNGGGGADLICGSSLRNVLVGGGGNDRMFGFSGNDRLKGGSGKDTEKGGGGKDTLLGDAGNDKLFGQGGRDLLKGGGGRDRLVGGGAPDRLIGGGGRDRLVGGAGRDTQRQ